MKYLFVVFFSLLGDHVLSQQVIHTRYDFTQSGSLPIAELDEAPPFIIKSLISVFHNGRYVINVAENANLDDGQGNSIQTEVDTILFDMKAGKAYRYSERQGYNFKPRSYSINGDTFKNKDTTITLSSGIPPLAVPTPTLGYLPKGVQSYKTRKFSFVYKDTLPTKLDMDALVARYTKFPMSDKEIDFPL